MHKLFLVLLSTLITFTSGQQDLECPDIPPDDTFPCEFQLAVGNCKTRKGLTDSSGMLVYCLVTCGLCDEVNLTELPADITSVDLSEQFAQSGGPTAFIEGKAFSVESLEKVVENEMTSAVVVLTEEQASAANFTEALIDGATATTEAVAIAIASAMSTVSLEGFTTDENSQARGIAEASATAIAEATAGAYAVAIAEAGDEFTELEAQTVTTDIQRALSSAAVELSITGDTQASIAQNSYATAVAQAVANATASAFAKIFGGESQAIAFAAAQAFNTSQLTCLPTCETEPPTEERDCLSYVAEDECSLIPGFCECSCRTCESGSEAVVETFLTLNTNSDVQQYIIAVGDAFATGAGDADAVATTFIDAVAQGKSELVADAVAEAVGAVDIPASAFVDIIAEAINQGGKDVVSAVADGFAIAEKGGDASALAQAISYALTTEEAGDTTATAMTTAISTAIANGGCAAVSQALTQAQAIAVEEGSGNAFAQSIADSDAINLCLEGSEEEVVDSTSDTYVATTSTGSAQASAEAIAKTLINGTVIAAASAIADAISEGRSTAIAEAIVIAYNDGTSAKAIAEAIAEAISEGDNSTVTAIAEAIAQVNSNDTVVGGEVIAAGLTGGGDAIASALTSAVANGGCSAISSALAQAESVATEQGDADAFASAVSESVAACLGTGAAIAETVASAVSSGDLSTIAETSATAYAQGEASALVTGMATAIENGAGCDAIADTLAIVAAEAETADAGAALSEAVAEATAVSNCLGAGIQDCRGSLVNTCCGDFPEECGCVRNRCRASKNAEKNYRCVKLVRLQ
eukprot:TRINITY_DN53_c0_g1_i11.p1 TRINITY_DN53_c0_g1~~TRINITY_DN53_c0_g1_i11.p1  ORF type:complete len:859 (+),score=153.76 TRINITY_DN53_c0_g1_i11:141-2579(+)